MTGSRILSLGHYQPSRVLTNDDLAQMVDTNDEWIRDRVGIATRRIAAPEETVADMAAAAAEKALAGSGLTAGDIDLVVVATCSSVDRCPNVATRVANKLGINAPGAYDLNTACSGFSYALGTVDHAIRAGASRNAIVVGAEKLSDVTDWTDRSTEEQVATATRSMSAAVRPDPASALAAAALAMSATVSSGAAIRRVLMPTRSWIHSSLVSTICARSLLVSTREGW